MNSNFPLMAMAGVDITRYFMATSGRSVMSTSSKWRSGISAFACSISFATNALAARQLTQPGAESNSTLIIRRASW